MKTRTGYEQNQTFTDDEIGQFVKFDELLLSIQMRLEGWEERLKTEPNGFPITYGIYDCNLCRRSMRDNETWYDQYGLKCPLSKGSR